MVFFLNELQPRLPVLDFSAAEARHGHELRVRQRDAHVFLDDDGGRASVFEYRSVFQLRVAQFFGPVSDLLFQGLIHLLQRTLGTVDVVDQHLGASADQKYNTDRDEDGQAAALQENLKIEIKEGRGPADDEQAGFV